MRSERRASPHPARAGASRRPQLLTMASATSRSQSLITHGLLLDRLRHYCPPPAFPHERSLLLAPAQFHRGPPAAERAPAVRERAPVAPCSPSLTASAVVQRASPSHSP
jgi:hypothetical protein